MKLRRLSSALLALLLAALCALNPPRARAEIRNSALKDDGVLRVYLRSLDSPGTLTLALDGVYTLNGDAGFRFSRGLQLRLYAGSDGIWMDAGGLTLNLGQELTLTRQAAAEGANNGLRIAETGRDNLYPGDLRVSLQGSGLRAVLSVGVEDYLCGVVAYEMSDSWPLEALKAQAVAARTYALRAKQDSNERDYDLVDTTSDQVYRGTDAKYQNVAEAVRATEGVVGTWKGKFATCFYTASNGGEVALPADAWGDDGDYGYIERKADPYDLENRHSLVAAARFRRDASDLPELRRMLEDALEASGAGREFDEIVSIEPVNPVAEGSRVCAALRFTLRLPGAGAARTPEVTATSDPAATATSRPTAGATEAGEAMPTAPAPEERAASEAAEGMGGGLLHALDLLRGESDEPSPTPSPAPSPTAGEPQVRECSVDLDVYDQIKRGLKLELNRADCEVASASETEDGFSVELRRFGHGVGMSQRGAQQMAGPHGMAYEEILGFYYPGMSLERIAWDAPELAALGALPKGAGSFRPTPSPSPTPAPLPALEAGEAYARVTLEEADSSMNLRESPTTQAAVVSTLAHNQRVIVSGEPNAEGWVRVRTAECAGYARQEYLTKE